MKYAVKSAILATVLGTTSACGLHERLRTVSDFCLNDRDISIEVAPGPGVDDPANRYDSDMTVDQVLEHNAVRDRLCPTASSGRPVPQSGIQ